MIGQRTKPRFEPEVAEAMGIREVCGEGVSVFVWVFLAFFAICAAWIIVR